ncbi:MAG: hypothetical protein VXY93_21860, partial [Pseudomonadota bacterium]|nr:hypothetical protein [Pseudomonadota bacterium]
SDTNSTLYTSGVTNNNASSGYITFNVPMDAPAHLYYKCGSHPNMLGNIYIVGQHLANGADNRVLTATSAYGMNGESALTFANSGSDPILTITNSGNPQLRLRTTGTTDNCTIDFGDGDAVNRGRIVYTNNGDNMLFYTNGTSGGEKLKLYSNGRLNLSTQQSITSDTMLHVEA